MNMKSFWSLLALVLLMAVTVSCSKSSANYEALVSRNIQCPEDTHLAYLPWGESGLEAVCLQKRGPSVVAEHGRIKIEGQYSGDKQVGEWRWFDESGTVVRTEQKDAR
ncbi:hypothetical protein [Paucibacter sp. XJ19-41]|uniref:hypothetical protein n=1 Tax=Paucibacter sp. XJ19-41 TaxID=2927824 RepID=UPI002348EEFD|nr:hypothetical protein [Paucibacter sp. XJ19-41]MDC6168740.1 hypothetical protein [Paucibacter sp. XJ19-41]